eukprot:jgi/Mesvir1/25338/Mv14022-RA.2
MSEVVTPSSPMDDDKCALCWEPLDTPCRTNCGHFFCGACILRVWQHRFAATSTPLVCPMCRQTVMWLTLMRPGERDERGAGEKGRQDNEGQDKGQLNGQEKGGRWWSLHFPHLPCIFGVHHSADEAGKEAGRAVADDSADGLCQPMPPLTAAAMVPDDSRGGRGKVCEPLLLKLARGCLRGQHAFRRAGGVGSSRCLLVARGVEKYNAMFGDRKGGRAAESNSGASGTWLLLPAVISQAVLMVAWYLLFLVLTSLGVKLVLAAGAAAHLCAQEQACLHGVMWFSLVSQRWVRYMRQSMHVF